MIFRNILMAGGFLILGTATAGAATITPPAAGFSGNTAQSGAYRLSQSSSSTSLKALSLEQALAETYLTNPTILAARAALRATDEGVPAAISGWRPTITATGSIGASSSRLKTALGNSQENEHLESGEITVTESLYSGGKTRASLALARDAVSAAVAGLQNSVQNVFLQATEAYVGVISARKVLLLNKENVAVLQQSLQATLVQYKVGTVTKTDVEQAKAALAGAVSGLENAAGNLQIADSVFESVIGQPPGKLITPASLAPPVKTQSQAVAVAQTNNPAVVAALFTDSEAKDKVNIAFSALLPQVDVQASVFHDKNTLSAGAVVNGGQALLQVTVPLYQGGAAYAAVRQAKQEEDAAWENIIAAKRDAVSSVIESWRTLQTAKAALIGTNLQIAANRAALIGVRKEQLEGTRTVLDVLNAQQALLDSEVAGIQERAKMITASYQVAAALGLLTATNLGLPVEIQNPYQYYNQTWYDFFGVGGLRPGYENNPA